MKNCYYCRGDLFEGTATLDKKHEGKHYLVEDVPARICSNCGERYFNSKILIAI
jgi:YgiT-type zinc finger domain-containing protein